MKKRLLIDDTGCRVPGSLLHYHKYATNPDWDGGVIFFTIEAAEIGTDVCGSGASIAAANLEHICEPFYQDEAQYVLDSAGQGLALVKEWTERMGGERRKLAGRQPLHAPA